MSNTVFSGEKVIAFAHDGYNGINIFFKNICNTGVGDSKPLTFSVYSVDLRKSTKLSIL